MRKHNTVLLYIAIIVSLYPTAIYAGKLPGLPFLRLPLDARSGALGGTGIALSVIPWNPSESVQKPASAAAFTHIRGINNTDTEFLGIIFKKGTAGAFGLSVFSNNIGGIEYRTLPTAAPQGIISAHDFFTGVSYFRIPQEGWQLGTTIRYLYQKMYIYNASGYSADCGLRYVPKSSRFSIGAGVYNLGSMNAFISEKPEMPKTIKIGGQYAFKPDASSIHNAVIIGEYEHLFTGKNSGHFGIEYCYRQMLFIRSGYATGLEERGFSAGAGIVRDRIGLNYAFLPDRSSVGSQHIFTVHIILTAK